MSGDPYTDVFEFHRKFGCKVGTKPAIPDSGTAELRERLLREEFEETVKALRLGDMAGIADGVCDLIYVAIGLAISYGIYLPEVWAEVHAANMRKVGGDTRDDGKVLKPKGWRGPDIEGVLMAQGWYREPVPEVL